ncbi:MAG: DEAD/DEAH box helicase [Thaumarchaeota archaeon]|nr:DEAD/DEAH box helicase [Nitrososphaerota archaeon]
MRFDEVQLPGELLEFLRSKGLSDLYPPQEEALKGGLLEGRSLVIASPTACYDKHTEVLTKKGWKLFGDTIPNEEVLSMNPKTFEMEYVRAKDKVEYQYRGRMVHVEGKEIDFRVTENHNMFVAKDPRTNGLGKNSGLRYDFRPARDIKPIWKFKTDGIWRGQRKKYIEFPPMKVRRGRHASQERTLPSMKIPMPKWLEFLGWYIAEGYTRYGDGYYEVTICQMKHINRAEEAIRGLGITKVRGTGTKNHRHFTVNSPQIARHLSQFGLAHEKFVPDYVKRLAPNQIKSFLDSYQLGDGNLGRDRVSPVFNTTSKLLADDIQELLLKIGISSSVRFKGLAPSHIMPDGHLIQSKHPSYQVPGRRIRVHGIDYRKRSKPSFETTDGEMVYCLTLPKYHLLYVRRNGKAFWCGNSGKTLIAIIAAYLKVKRDHRKVVYLSPLRALASEKYGEFGELQSLGVRTVISTGDFDSSGESLGRGDIIVLTNERFDSVMRHSVSWLRSVGLFIADEVHLAGSDSRGPTLEMILSKVVYLGLDAQLLSLSATISNAQELSKWLDSKLISLNWRPVPLREAVYDYGRLMFLDGEERPIVRSAYGAPIDVAADAVKGGGQSLIFASTRRRAVSLATKAAEITSRMLTGQEKDLCAEAARRIRSTGEETSLSKLLAEIVARGSAFHHAGLEHEHRKVVEDYYRLRAIKILAATPTLCLPAGEEIFGNPGPVPIEQLSTGDRVLTHARRFMPVVSPVVRPYKGSLIKVTPWCQLPMRMTPEHKVLKVVRTRHSIHTRKVNKHWWSYSEPSWTQAKNLKLGDLVVFPVIKEEKDMESLELPENGPLSNQSGVVVVGKHWSRLKVSRLPLSEKTLEILGLYVAEGYTGSGGQIMFALNQNEIQLMRRVCSWFKGLGLNYRVIDSSRHRRVIRACSKQLAEKLDELFGTSAETKKIPHDFLFLPNEKLIPFIRGILLGDGSPPSSAYRVAREGTTSRVLAKQFFAALVKIGFMPSIKRNNVAGKTTRGVELKITHKHDMYNVSVSGRQLGEFWRTVMHRKARKATGNREFNRGHRDSEYYYMPIRRIEKEEFVGNVYNLEVQGQSSYVGSFVVHNSSGVNLPARRVVIADITRYDVETAGNSEIPVLEYRQMAGRAGRPQYDEYGETVIVPPPSYPSKQVLEHYAGGEPEPILSRLSSEGAMRVHVLATIATSTGLSRIDVESLFSKTLLALQSGKDEVMRHIDQALGYLIVEKLVESKAGLFYATDFGKRVSILYIDPASGVLFRDGLRAIEPDHDYTAGLLHLVASTPDFEPKFPLRNKDLDQAIAFLDIHSDEMIWKPQKKSFMDYDETLQNMRSVMALYGWIDEWREEELLSKLGVEPGDMHRAVDNADWLLYSLGELGKLFKKGEVTRGIAILRKRVTMGVSGELLELTTLQGVGRVRARSLYTAGYRRLEDLKEVAADKLALVPKVGTALARKIKEQVSNY